MLARVRLFAIARERAGVSTLEIELPEGSTVLDLKSRIAREVPSLALLLPTIRLAIDAEYADDGTTIATGSDLALIPPVSGGSDLGMVR